MLGQYFQVLLAFLFVIGLIGLLSVALRKFSFDSFVVKKSADVKRSLSIVEILPLDSRRKLVLVKNGTKKHLLLLGGNGDLLVESFDE
jgi:flagellar protein FliO/FliZ